MANEMPMGKMRLVAGLGIQPHLPKKLCGLLQSWRSVQILQILSEVSSSIALLGYGVCCEHLSKVAMTGQDFHILEITGVCMNQ